MSDEAAERIVRMLVTGGFDIGEFKKSLEEAGRKYVDVYEDEDPQSPAPTANKSFCTGEEEPIKCDDGDESPHAYLEEEK